MSDYYLLAKCASSVVFVVVLQLQGGCCDLSVYPETASVGIGEFVSFHCTTTDDSVNAKEDLRWMHTNKRDDFLDVQFVFAFGKTFSQWKGRSNVTVSSDGSLTLTIGPVNSSEFGFFTCSNSLHTLMATGELKELSGDDTAAHLLSQRIVKDSEWSVVTETQNSSEEERNHNTITNTELFFAEPQAFSVLTIHVALFVAPLGVVFIVALVVLFFVCFRFTRSAKSFDPEKKQQTERFVYDNPGLQGSTSVDLVVQVADYETIPVYEEAVNRLMQSTTYEVINAEETDNTSFRNNEKPTSEYASLHRQTSNETPIYTSLKNKRNSVRLYSTTVK